MWVWFKSISDRFDRTAPDGRTVRRLLASAAERGAPIGVGEVDPGVCAAPRDGFVERVEAESLLIRCANDEPIPALLVEGARVQLSILTASGFEQGEVTVLGEWDMQDDAVHRRGVRVTIPQALIHVQRRLRHRLPVAFDLSPRATLHEEPHREGTTPATEGGGPTVVDESAAAAQAEPSLLGAGDVLDISETGARIRLLGSPECDVPQPGRIIRMSATFPACFPSFGCSAEIVHSGAAVHGEGWILGLRFLHGHPDLGRAIHQLELRRAQRSVR